MSIDSLPKKCWEVEEWVGPVYGVAGKSGKINMDSSQTVVVKLKLIPGCVPPPTATAPATPAPPSATGGTGATDTRTQPAVQRRADSNTLIIAYDGWTGTYLPSYVLKVLFEDELGYSVRVADQSTIPEAFESVASGETDMFTSAWFPARDFTFNNYPNLVKLGQVYGGKTLDA